MLGYAIQSFCSQLVKSRRFVALTASAPCPGGFGCYGRVALIETDGINKPSRIDRRLSAVKRIVRTWESLNVGKTERSAFYVALRQAESLAAGMNAAA